MALSQVISSPPILAIDDEFDAPGSRVGSVVGSVTGFHRLPSRLIKPSGHTVVSVAEDCDTMSDDGHSVAHTYNKCSCCDDSFMSGSTLAHEDFSESTFIKSYRKTTCESSYSAAGRFAKMIELLSNVSVEAFSLKDFYEKVSIEHEAFLKKIADLRACYHHERQQHHICQGHLRECRSEFAIYKETHEKEVTVLKEKHEKEVISLKEQIKELQKEVTVIRNERDHDRREHTRIVEKLKETHEKETKIIKETHEKEVKIIKEHSEKTIKELKEKYEKEIKCIRDEHKTQIIDIERSHETKIVDIRKHYETKIVDIEKKHETVIRELKEKHESVVKELKEHRETVIRELKEKHETFIRDIKEKHESIVRELKEKNETTVREITSRFESISKEYKEFKQTHEHTVKELRESHEKVIKELKETHKTQIEKTIIDTRTSVTTEIRESETESFDCERKEWRSKHKTAIGWWKAAEDAKAATEKHYRKEIEELHTLHDTEIRKLKYQLAEFSSSEESSHHHHHANCGCGGGKQKQHGHSHASTSHTSSSSSTIESSSSSSSVSVEVTEIKKELTIATSNATQAQARVKEVTHERDQLKTKVKQLETDLAAAKAAVAALPAPAKKPTHGQGSGHSISWIMYHNQMLTEETHVNGTSWIHKPFARDLAFNINENLWDAVARLAAPGQSGYHVDPRSLGCDPARGKTKTMIVAYHTAGSSELQYAAAVDGDMLRFPALSSSGGSTAVTAVNNGAVCVEEA